MVTQKYNKRPELATGTLPVYTEPSKRLETVQLPGKIYQNLLQLSTSAENQIRGSKKITAEI